MTFDEKNQIVILKDASFIDVYALIEFIYKGEVNIGQVSNQLWYIEYIWSIYVVDFRLKNYWSSTAAY